MLDIDKLQKFRQQIVVVGTHPLIIQSILDFDYLANKDKPSVVGILSNEAGVAKYFWGKDEILLPVYRNVVEAPFKNEPFWFLNLLSGRRALSSAAELVNACPHLLGGVFFAENVPEKHALELFRLVRERKITLIGPASVGLVVPGVLKLGPIGGITPTQIDEAKLVERGEVAVLSASGGMTNELINALSQKGLRLSFALSFGGDRFPIYTPEQAFLTAVKSTATKTIVYYGELGGFDEYKLIELKRKGKITKPVIAHIAGTVAELFPESPQFGHAKAKATHELEKASVKRQKLREAGFSVSENFAEFISLIK